MAIGVKIYEYVGKYGLTNTIANRHTPAKPIEEYIPGKKEGELGRSRALRYSPNQESIYVDEQKGDVQVSEIVFNNGELKVPFNKPSLIKFMNAHPDNQANGGHLFREYDPKAQSVALKKEMDLEIDAMIKVREMDQSEKVEYLRNYLPSRVDKMDESDIDLAVAQRAKQDPARFLEVLADPAQDRKNTIASAFAKGIITWKKGNSQVAWSHGTRNTNICRIPEGEDPNEALERHFISNKGNDTFEEIEIILDEL